MGKCSICGQLGHNKNNKKFHPNKMETPKANNEPVLVEEEPKNERILLEPKKYPVEEPVTPQELKMDKYNELINQNKYLSKKHTRKGKDPSSLSYLCDIKLSQSECIQLGNAIESLIRDICMKNLTLINIKEKNIKGKKECDLLFKCECTKQIYYAEVKCNINLDTEKSKSTIDKIMIIVTELQKSYPDYKINSYLIAARYIHSKDISHTLLNKYSEIKENVCGINDFIEIIGCSDMKFGSESEYKCFINKVAYKLLN